MILVDTSIWIDHLRGTETHLSVLLTNGQVCMHPHVLGEIALGSLRNRKIVLDSMRDLPQATVATDEEVFRFVEDHTLFGLGIGYTDAHLLAAACLSPGTQLWTRDRRLGLAATRLSLSFTTTH